MNNIHSVQAFIGEGTRIVAQTDIEAGFSLRFSVGDSDITLFLATLSPEKSELEAAARLLDDLVLAAVDLKTTVIRELAKPVHIKPFHLDGRDDCPACIVEKAVRL